MNFWRKVLTAGRQGKYFQFSSWISICRNRTCKKLENRSKANVFMSKVNFEYCRDFALSGEISLIINFRFMQYFLLELKDFILSKYFVTFNDNFE